MTNPKTKTTDGRLIESDAFAFEFLSGLAERESWRKEIHRPVYHIHKWWAQRLGSVFRGLLLGSVLPAEADLANAFYNQHSFDGVAVFDPFMGSGTTIGEAHKLGMTALGRDINPVAVRGVATALGPMDRRSILSAFQDMSERAKPKILSLYRSSDSRGNPCDVLYHFWVMQASCPDCAKQLDLFPSHVIARNAHPDRKSHVQVRCPACSTIFPITHSPHDVTCTECRHRFDANVGPASGAKASCDSCHAKFTILDAIGDATPRFRLYGKLVLRSDGCKEYLSASNEDLSAYEDCSRLLREQSADGTLQLPSLALSHGYNTRQAMNYNFRRWIDFFNDRQLLALGWLRSAILDLPDAPPRHALLTLFSGSLEFNNMFASYKGEGTGAVRHMFSHHILKPERTPIEANVWGTPKSSGGFSNLFRGRLLRAIDYRDAPTEVNGSSSSSRVCSAPFSGTIEPNLPTEQPLAKRAIYLSTGDSAKTTLPERSIDVVATDPPFFDNVHYSELADFFHAWQQMDRIDPVADSRSTRETGEVQDGDAAQFGSKLCAVFRECNRVLKDDGLLVFTYHHSRNEGWRALAEAIWGAGFRIVNSHPVKSEMSVATPKLQAKDPIQLDIILVCRKRLAGEAATQGSPSAALERGRSKIARLADAGLKLSRNDRRIILIGQLLGEVHTIESLDLIHPLVEQAVDDDSFFPSPRKAPIAQLTLFGDNEA